MFAGRQIGLTGFPIEESIFPVRKVGLSGKDTIGAHWKDELTNSEALTDWKSIQTFRF